MHSNRKGQSLNERSPSFRKMVHEEAVVVRNATKAYGEKMVFNGLDMTVSRASIYGLLGASGCGKTTLLSCIVGVRRLDSGEVWVLGGQPGSKGSGIPGPRVGYMPQEISLVGEFTVSGALYYFGRINGLEDVEIEARQDFLMDLLQLPPRDRLVKNMSGGQQRRVSFAAALIHQPELLILDEPTVGLDPILRENIWVHLIKITQTEGATVLITTHYIEETKDASKIGLLRNGQLLAESSPQQLLEQFRTLSLEEVFLTLSQAQNNRTSIVARKAQADDISALSKRHSKAETSKYQKTSNKVSSARRFKALMAKNSVQFFRYYSGIVFAVFFPILQVCAFFIGVGGEPKGLKIGVVNDEAGNCDYGNNIGNIWYNEVDDIPRCNWTNLSCRFLHNYKDTILVQEYYDDVPEAIAAVHNGKLTGIMHFGSNFSDALLERLDVSFDTVNTSRYLANVVASEIDVFLDMSELHTGSIVKKVLLDRFFQIFRNVLIECGYLGKFADIPVRFEDPVYGLTAIYSGYRQFMAPNYMLTLAFFLATYVSSSLIINDRAEGVWNRSLVQGVKTEEILLSHFLTQAIIVCIHTAMMMLLIFSIWGLEYQGSLFTVTLFVFLMGLTGLMYGFCISIVCSNHTMAHYAAAGSFWPLVLLTGSIWPIEGMPLGLRYISYIMPTTLPAMSLRAVIDKTKAIYEWEVFNGILIILAWILLLMMLSIISLRSRSKFS